MQGYWGARSLDLLRTVKSHWTSACRISFTELRAFLLSLVGRTFSSCSPSSWGFLLKGLVARPRRLAEAVTMAVKGHHYFRMTRIVLEGRSQNSESVVMR